MNYGQVRDQVLKLLNQETIAGAPIPGSYNNQQDYLNRIPTLVNDAMMEIATTARKIPATLNLNELFYEDLGRVVRYELPGNFYQFVSGSVVKTADGVVLHSNVYSTQDKKYLLVPKDEAGDYSVTYYRYPMVLDSKPDDRDELDNAPETHPAVAFYVAAHLVIHDEPFLYASFYNKYEDKLLKMGPGVSVEVRSTDDVYGFFG